jgi:hypothetical protein
LVSGSVPLPTRTTTTLPAPKFWADKLMGERTLAIARLDAAENVKMCCMILEIQK